MLKKQRTIKGFLVKVIRENNVTEMSSHEPPRATQWRRLRSGANMQILENLFLRGFVTSASQYRGGDDPYEWLREHKKPQNLGEIFLSNLVQQQHRLSYSSARVALDRPASKFPGP